MDARLHYSGERGCAASDRREEDQLLCSTKVRRRTGPCGAVPHMLDMARYQTEEDAEYDSWFLLEPLVEGTGADAADEVVPMEQV